MPKSRMSGVNRRDAIIMAAKKVFAENGLRGTSVKSIAQAAGVSEALLYKHFSSKEELYSAVLQFSRDLGLAHITELKNVGPGTEALVFFVYLLVETITLGVPERSVDQKAHERLFFRSLVSNNEYAEKALETVGTYLFDDLILASFDAAARAGDLVESPISCRDRMWFVHHLSMAMNLCNLTGSPTCEYATPMPKLAEHAVLFCLRGLGLTDQAIRKYYQPDTLRAQMMRLHEGLSSA
ncbi:MAG: helix-turn-helix transcriptional regulator [Chloroflexi bacterium]|nr:helix-turn-helix transcriptional regulator [Chloroflexota bacterium]